MTRLTGRVALITGALKGIGLACAERMLAEGARVILTDLAAEGTAEPEAVLARLGADARYIKLDVAGEADWLAALPRIEAAFGRLDIAVANAGVDCTGAVEDIAFAAWRRIMGVNVDGVFLTVKTLTPLLAQSGATTPAGSSIVIVSSIMGLVGMSEVSPYNASKGAIRLFAKSVAIEFAEKRTPIRVNSVHPGFVKTPLLEAGMERWATRPGAPSAAELIAGVAASTPTGRLAEASEIAATIAFLASDDASYMTGSELVVDGGWTAR